MKFPKFELMNENNEIVSHNDLLGQYTVLFFYPRDNTPTCTQQACMFRDIKDTLKSLNAKVYGISGDSAKKHTNFINKHDLNFSLLVDEDYQLSEQLDVYKLKKVFGKESKGIVRTTFILDEQNEIVKRFDQVKVKNHMDEVVEAIKIAKT